MRTTLTMIAGAAALLIAAIGGWVAFRSPEMTRGDTKANPKQAAPAVARPVSGTTPVSEPQMPHNATTTDPAQDLAQHLTNDPVAALEWMAHSGDARMATDPRVQSALASAATTLATGIGERAEGSPTEGINRFVQTWATLDVASALEWSCALEDGPVRDDLIARVAYVESQTNPADAAGVVVQEIPAGPRQEEAAISVLHQWALKDMAAATAWVERFPPGHLRDRAIQELEGVVAYSKGAVNPAPGR